MPAATLQASFASFGTNAVSMGSTTQNPYNDHTEQSKSSKMTYRIFPPRKDPERQRTAPPPLRSQTVMDCDWRMEFKPLVRREPAPSIWEGIESPPPRRPPRSYTAAELPPIPAWRLSSPSANHKWRVNWNAAPAAPMTQVGGPDYRASAPRPHALELPPMQSVVGTSYPMDRVQTKVVRMELQRWANVKDPATTYVSDVHRVTLSRKRQSPRGAEQRFFNAGEVTMQACGSAPPIPPAAAYPQTGNDMRPAGIFAW